MALPEDQTKNSEAITPAEQKNILLPGDKWTDEYAAKIVKADWGHAETYRTNSHDWRYRNAHELYLGYSGQKYWEGSRVPRSSLGVPVTFMQVESLLPKIVSLVTDTDSYHFYNLNPSDEAEDELGVTAWREMVCHQLDETRFREQVRRAAKCLVTLGNGVLESGMEEVDEEFISFSSQQVVSGMSQVMHPMAGPMQVPQTQNKFTRKITKEKTQKPYIRYVSLADFYVDPSCESTCLQDAKYVIKRGYTTTSEIKKLAGNKDFKIPNDLQLELLVSQRSSAQQDQTKSSAEQFRYSNWTPSLDYTSDPSQKKLELIEYTTASRKIWMLGRMFIIYNQPNRYGQINYFSAPYADVLDRWHAMGVADVVEGEQRLQQAIVNARVDELSLSLHRPMTKRRGVTIPAYQLKVRPGLVIETENPDTDIKQMEVQNITQQAFVEVDASERRTQKITGMTDLAALGTSSSGGNSANRTAAGINTQAGATGDRVRYLVENIEDQLIEPVVNFVIKLNRKFLDMQRAAAWLQLDPRFAKLDPKAVMNMKVAAECRGSEKMAARQGFLQIFPMLAQTVLNPELLQMMGQVNKKKLDPKALMDMLMDAINYAPKRPLFEDMTAEDQQAANQPPPQAVMQAQMQQQQLQSDQQMNQNNLKTKLIDTLLKKAFDHHGHVSELDDKFLLEVMGQQQQSGGDGEAQGGEPAANS